MKKTIKKQVNSKNGREKKNPVSANNGKTSKSPGRTNGKSPETSPDSGSALKDFFVDGLKDLYWAEQHLVKSLPKMAKASNTNELKELFVNHLSKTKAHVSKLEEVFQLLNVKAQAKKCDGMEGLTKEADKTIEETKDNSMTRDAALIIAAQKVEHYEIASYGGLTQLAHTMGLNDAANILGEIFQEEKEADALLTEIAERSINVEAEQEA